MVGVYWAARPYDAGDLVGLSRRLWVVTKKCTFLLRPGLDQLRRPGIVRVRSQVRVSPTTCLRGIVQGDMVGVYWAARPYDSGLRSWSNPGRNKKVHFFVTTRVGPTPKARHRKVRVSPTTCLRGIVQGDMVGVYWAGRPYDSGLRSWSNPGPGGDMVGVYWAARPYDAGDLVGLSRRLWVVTKKVHFFCYDPGWTNSEGPASVRSQVRVSPTTCLCGIVQGDKVVVYWAARPYDAGPSELVQPGSVRSQVRVSPTTCLRGIVQGDMVGVYWAARPYDSGLRSWSNPGRNKKVHFFVTTRVGPTPKARHRKVRVSPTTCLRGIVQGDMVGVYWAARPYDSGLRSWSNPGRNKKVHFFVTTRVGPTPKARHRKVRVSPTTCLCGIVQGDKVVVYWAARPYDAGPSELPNTPQPYRLGQYRGGRLLVRLEPETSPFNSQSQGLLSPIELQLNWVRSQVRVSPTTCLRGIVQGDMVGVYWAARPYDSGLRSWSNPGRNKLD
ncbi:hypothetical protein LXL04_023469 [Taraxacum kok-saghyz]